MAMQGINQLHPRAADLSFNERIMSLESAAERTAELFGKCFGHAPRWIVAAPGRVNLIGEHTDYNDGFVLPIATQQSTVIAAERVLEREVTVHSETNGETAVFPIKSPIPKGDPSWSNYIRGVVAGMQQKGRKVGGFNAVVYSEVPYGGSLASSAALEVATATLLEAMNPPPLDPIEKAVLCQKAEHEYADVPCGIMDQFTAVLARENHALLLDCRARTTEAIALKDPAVTVLIINTNVRHRLAEGEYARRRAQCETAAKTLGVRALRDATINDLQAARSRLDPVVFRRARHVITENERTLKAATALQNSDWTLMGRLMYESHASLKDDYEVSCPELDVVVGVAKSLGTKAGVIGCRMTGAGFGGCAVSLVRTDKVLGLTRRIEELYEAATHEQASMFHSRPGGGARVLSSF